MSQCCRRVSWQKEKQSSVRIWSPSVVASLTSLLLAARPIREKEFVVCKHVTALNCSFEYIVKKKRLNLRLPCKFLQWIKWEWDKIYSPLSDTVQYKWLSDVSPHVILWTVLRARHGSRSQFGDKEPETSGRLSQDHRTRALSQAKPGILAPALLHTTLTF